MQVRFLPGTPVRCRYEKLRRGAIYFADAKMLAGLVTSRRVELDPVGAIVRRMPGNAAQPGGGDYSAVFISASGTWPAFFTHSWPALPIMNSNRSCTFPVGRLLVTMISGRDIS
jgi:hypothetical protein